MSFKNFNVDYNKVTIDDSIVNRPVYMSASQWYDFWDFASHALKLGSFSAVIKEAEITAFKEGETNSETEHERELEDQQRLFETNISRAVRLIETEAAFEKMHNQEFLKKVEEILFEAIPTV